MTFRWRERTGRPPIPLDVHEVSTVVWDRFKAHHYLTAELNRSAHCYVAEVDGRPVAFIAIRYQPLSSRAGWMFHREVVLPEWQGCGIGMALFEAIAREYQEREPHRVRVTPRHPGLCRAFARSPLWRCVRAMGPSHRRSKGGSRRPDGAVIARSGAAAARGEVTATFEWRGP